MIGKPIIMDRITTSMCDNAYGRANFARVLVEIDALKGLIENIDVYYKSLGKAIQLKVEYPWKPPVCCNCKVFGHGEDKCGKTVIVDGEKNQNADKKKSETRVNDANMEGKNEDWKTVDNRKKAGNIDGNTATSYTGNGQRMGYGESSFNRGGFNGRGRGNMFGRGNSYSRNTRYNSQYVPAKKVNEVNTANDKGKGKVNDIQSEVQKANVKSNNKTIEVPGNE
ncbi:ATPase, F1/V1/A1 complex, alpha/beta subunit, Zinc knuckle CX2CX4HX4C [Artemisia annua]|uniref:ATPase, F1/V1/A1 complex, alpha/beta subunit, Zinc knuckle CX2CX4HX4C n=1 Tax=Artemisia annua TaxID=35608 RepID=A0A2U1L3X4_ARTAN|nr:ATPase, F1/V1/A1 complex, alpha/beta subunit, Zinc knuckle CX2CX4HX4C [Artemisia annua]